MLPSIELSRLRITRRFFIVVYMASMQIVINHTSQISLINHIILQQDFLSKVLSSSLLDLASLILISGNVRELKFSYLLLWDCRYVNLFCCRRKTDRYFKVNSLHVCRAIKTSGSRNCIVVFLNVNCPVSFLGNCCSSVFLAPFW